MAPYFEEIPLFMRRSPKVKIERFAFPLILDIQRLAPKWGCFSTKRFPMLSSPSGSRMDQAGPLGPYLAHE